MNGEDDKDEQEEEDNDESELTRVMSPSFAHDVGMESTRRASISEPLPHVGRAPTARPPRLSFSRGGSVSDEIAAMGSVIASVSLSLGVYVARQ
jgi:hypothetical protein